jgi:2-oxoglutarate ferredoxin oxidoreductase subunit beta
MERVFGRPESLAELHTHYCPGCTHGIAHRLLAEAFDELGLRERVILVAPVGCAVFAYDYFEVDACEAAHGRAPAMATGIKRLQPENIVVAYQGDGDLASIGAAEILHAAARGEQITTIFINNAVYGMTGGQMAPTSLLGQKTTSSPSGRDARQAGYPLHMSELLSLLDGSAYIVRRSLHDVRHIRQSKKAILTALKAQMNHLGFSMVELLSSCPTNWGLSPQQALQWIEDRMLPQFPLGDYKVVDAVRELEKRTG